MWVPLTWIIDHWIGLFHSIMRTILIVILWYLFPSERFITIPLTIVVIYIISILVLKERKIQAEV